MWKVKCLLVQRKNKSSVLKFTSQNLTPTLFFLGPLRKLFFFFLRNRRISGILSSTTFLFINSIFNTEKISILFKATGLKSCKICKSCMSQIERLHVPTPATYEADTA